MKFLVTPDYGLSDIWNFNYPLKDLLSQSLKILHFPLWTDMVGNGFPIGAEGQIGMFSPINWIVFGLFPMPMAFIMAYVVSFLILGFGAYLYAKEIGLSKTTRLTTVLFVSVNGFFICHMTHLNLLQSFSFIPLALYGAEYVLRKSGRRPVLLLALIFAQMILVGYPQTLINSAFALSIYMIVRKPRAMINSLFKLFLAGFISILLTAVQVIPLVELVLQSDTITAAGNQRFIQPLPPTHLLTFINPFLFGDPSLGTYVPRMREVGFLWENMFYPGLIPMAIVVLGCFLFRKIKIQKKYYLILFGLLVVFGCTLLLSLGKNTPLDVLFKVPPLSFTRIESRFLAITHISLAFAAAIFLSLFIKNTKKQIVVVLLLALGAGHLFQVIWVFRSYHLWGNSEKWLEQPSTVAKLKSLESRKIISINQESRWNEISVTKGWHGKENIVLNNRASLGQNSNMIFGVRQLGVYAQQLPKRQEMIQRNMYGDDALGKNIRNVYGVTNIIDGATGTFEIINNPTALPDVYIPVDVVPVRDADNALGKLNREDFHPGKDVLWESNVLPNNDEQVVVFNRSWYPGWRAFLNKKELTIYPVNINQQAVIVPKGTEISTIDMRYDPWSYKLGASISLFTLTGLLIVWRKEQISVQ